MELDKTKFLIVATETSFLTGLKYVVTYLVCVVSLVLHSRMTNTIAFMHININRVVDFIDQVHKKCLMKVKCI